MVAAIKAWGSKFSGKRLQIVSDNEASVMVLNSGSTRDTFMQGCLHEILFYAAIWEFDVRAIHCPGVENRIPDLL